MKNFRKLSGSLILVGVAVSLSGCASLSQKELKSPCGPIAGLTDPCGDRTPINSMQDIESVFSEDYSVKETA